MRENTDHGLERRRKEAKRLLRDLRVGDEDAAARVGAVLGARAAKRFVLADAQHVIAVEHGFRSWAGLREHGETVIDSGLSGAPDIRDWLQVAEEAVEKESMNINRRGVVFVQVVEGRDLAKPAGQVARASLAVYTALLEVDE